MAVNTLSKLVTDLTYDMYVVYTTVLEHDKNFSHSDLKKISAVFKRFFQDCDEISQKLAYMMIMPATASDEKMMEKDLDSLYRVIEKQINLHADNCDYLIQTSMERQAAKGKNIGEIIELYSNCGSSLCLR